MTDEPLYYAKGNEVWKRPIETPREGGGKTISIGFKVCTCTDVVGLKGAETVAKMLSLAEGHPDAYRHGWEDREADLIDGAKRVLSAPSSPGDGWVMVPREPTDEMLLKGHHQIDWGRDDQPTNTNDDPLQKPGGVGTTCKEDLRDAYRAMLSAAPSPGGDHGA